MKYIGEFMSYILLAVFAQNMLVGRAIGLDSLLSAIRGKKFLPKLLAATGGCCTAGIMLMWLLSRFVTGTDTFLIFGLLHSLLCAVLYFASDRLLLRFSPEQHDVWGGILPHALINGIVIGTPVAALAGSMPHWYNALGSGIGTAVGLWLAVIIIQNGMDVLDHPDMPEVFKGMPAMLIYLGILSMGFCAFL